MATWQPGDPIGQIGVGPDRYQLPDRRTATAYGSECLRQIIEAMAREVCACPDLHRRQWMIANYAGRSKNKFRLQKLLKDEVIRQWRSNRA
jgi:hypothetical protein